MRSILAQDWITVRGVGNTTTVTQSEAEWLDLEPYSDCVLWVEVAEATNNSFIYFETAPAAVESLFQPIELIGAVASPTPIVRKIYANVVQGFSLARFLRWKVVNSGAGVFDVTFRVHVTVSPGIRDAFSPLNLPGLLLWLRADLGTVLSGADVVTWQDQSGNGNHVGQSVSGSRPRLNATIGGKPAIDFSTSRFLENTATNLISTGGQPYSVLTVAQNGSGALLTLRRSTKYSASMFFIQTDTFVHGDGIDPLANVKVPNTSAITQSAVSAFKSCHRYNGAAFGLPQTYLNGALQSIIGGSRTAPPPASSSAPTPRRSSGTASSPR
jgi:hypothetical protein